MTIHVFRYGSGLAESNFMKPYLLTLCAVFCTYTYAQNPVELYNNCATPTSQTSLDINNVRTTLLNAGDLWWNLSNGRYEIPKGSGLHSMFNGAIWIAALDDNDQLKVAAQTYRQSGNDFWPGPLDTDSTISSETCLAYDQHYSLLRSEVLAHKYAFENDELDNYHTPEAILNWPGNYYNEPNKTLAPFEDLNQNGIYEPEQGEYPAFDFNHSKNCRTDNILMGDQSIWWVMNDVGNVHTESGSQTALGLEIHAQAFAMISDKALNNTTFYQYRLINRSNKGLYEAYYGNWLDCDIGNYGNDFVGCHVSKGLGYFYNGEAFDGTSSGYGEHPPAIGIDIMQGPLAPINDGLDNDYDGIIDEDNEEMRMTGSLYFNGPTGTPTQHPETPINFYNYLRGQWLDGLLLTFGGVGRNQLNPPCKFMLSGNTDPDFPGENWTECTAGNYPSDRTYLTSIGPFTFEPGQTHTITNALVWSQDLTESENPHLASLEKLFVDDAFVQEAFDNCFEMECSEPKYELYSYQLIGKRNDECNTKVVQFYYPNESAVQSINSVLWYFGDGTTSNEFNPYHEYQQAGTYEILIYIENDCGSDYGTFKVEIPCILQDDINSVQITRTQGIGNGNRMVDLSDKSHKDIFDTYSQDTISYKVGKGPFQVYIPNPLNVSQGDYQLNCISETSSESSWVLKNLITDDSLEFTSLNEQLTTKIETIWGFNIQLEHTEASGDNYGTNGTIGINKMGPIENWLDFIKDNETHHEIDENHLIHPHNWIRSGIDKIDHIGVDNNEYFETEYKGEWAPYRLSAHNTNYEDFKHAPAWRDFQALSALKTLNNIDIVFTSDTTKWTRVPIIETGKTNNYERLNLKENPSVDKQGNPDGTGNGFGWFPGYALDVIQGKRLNIMFGEASEFELDNGNDMLWNPTARVDSGYMYADLSDNPTDEYKVIFGGRHYIYITKTQYMGDDETLHPQYDKLTGMSSGANKRNVFKEISWVSIPMGVNNRELLSDEVTIQLRVKIPFQEFTSFATEEVGLPIYQFSIDRNDYYNPLSENEFLLFPNPSADNLFLILDNDSIESIYTQIYSSDGKLVLQSDEQENAVLQMDISRLATGIYHCVLYGDHKKMSAQSFIKK